MQMLQSIKKYLNSSGEKISEKGLIRVDYRVILLTFAVFILFILAVIFRINGSSMQSWDAFQPGGRQENTGVLFGSPKPIRSDEWMVSTPWALSQAKLGYPVENENVGANSDPLLTNIPVRHFSTIFRPQDWGYFSLGVERGFAFMWNFKIFGLLIGFFFLLMILTRNHFWLSLAGSIWILFSGFTQWWFSTPLPETLASLALAFVGIAYLLVAKRKILIIAGALLLVIFSLNFVLFFYPAFQVPLLWVAVALLAGFLLTDQRWHLFKSRLWFRIPIITGSAFVMIVVLYFFYQDARETINAVINTDYPGTRVIEGGSIGIAKMFSGFTGVPYSTKRFPPILENACEASNYILFFPVIFLAWSRNYILRIKNNRLVSALLIYLFFISAWILVKFPHLLAKIGLLNYVPSSRALVGLGVASILVTIIFLAETDLAPMDRSFVWGASIFVFVFMILYGFQFNQFTGDWLHNRYVLLMAVLYTVLSYLLLTKKRVAFLVLMLLVLAPYYMVNPIAYGLDPIYKNQVVITASEINSREPNSRWVEYGGNTLANLLKTAGVHIVDGNKYTPDLDLYRALDPGREYQSIYNRYSDVVYGESKEGSGKEVEFVLIQADSFAVLIDPCSPKLKELGINFFVFNHKPAAEKVSCLEPVASLEESQVWFFKRISN